VLFAGRLKRRDSGWKAKEFSVFLWCYNEVRRLEPLLSLSLKTPAIAVLAHQGRISLIDFTPLQSCTLNDVIRPAPESTRRDGYAKGPNEDPFDAF